MKAIVADAHGYGSRRDVDGNWHELSPDHWTEIDVRDQVLAGVGSVTVRYRDDGREVEVLAGHTYDIEYTNNDVIDVRTADTTIDELLAAMQGIGTDERRVIDVLEAVSGIRDKVDALKAAYLTRTRQTLEDALRSELSGRVLDDALRLIA